jgi:hypothetical protein
MRRFLTSLAALLTVFACGGSATVVIVLTPASVAVQSGDVPSGLHKCDLSGDINSFLTKIKTKDPTNYDTTKKEWDDAQKVGATSAEIVFFAESVDKCSSVTSSTSQFGSSTDKLVLNFVIQFKDEASAAKGYTTESIFGLSTSSLKTGGLPVVEGKDTGLGTNSIVLTVSLANQSFYIAVWQKKAFMVILAVLNIDTATSKKIALAVNGRIH